ncbi:hypothetical protein NO932_02405 [Pelagibacterium sp. 26DY04]|uniref:hypothetical protein n=1 Tax=Pelagibacterium sp. 26DY04 TaxID=2967130 RepID=UPI002815A981|nr:hypothetical protein [Pelagibacterium sp. 26DY04]WMT87478.1 hypothetical protein NO932_02405 [Pelagibacterium sp. 26DY04]
MKSSAWSRLSQSDSTMLAFSNLSRSLCYLVPVPILYAVRTPADVSVWLVMTTLLGMQNLLFIGVPHVLVRMLSYADTPRESGTGNGACEPSLKELAQFTRAAFSIFTVLLLVLLSTLGTAALFLPISHMGSPADGWLAWAMIVALAPLRVVLLRQLTYLNGRGIVAEARRIDGLAWLGGGVVATVGILLLPSLALMVLIMHLCIGAAIILIAALCRDNGWVTLSRGGDIDSFRRTLSVVWAPIWRTGVGTLMSTGTRQSIGLVVAQYSSPPIAAAYLMAQQAITVLTMLSSAPVLSRLHTMTYAFRNRDYARVALVAGQATSRSLWIAAGLSALIGLLIPFTRSFPQFETAFVDVELWCILAVTLLIQRNAAAHLQTYSITNVIVWHWLDGLTGIVSLGCALIFIPGYGGWGAAMAGLVGILVVYAWCPLVLNHRQFGIPFPAFEIRTALAPAVVFAVSMLIAYMLSRVF